MDPTGLHALCWFQEMLQERELHSFPQTALHASTAPGTRMRDASGVIRREQLLDLVTAALRSPPGTTAFAVDIAARTNEMP
jgi:hypothetical protein